MDDGHVLICRIANIIRRGLVVLAKPSMSSYIICWRVTLDREIGWAAVRFHGIALGDILRKCGLDCSSRKVVDFTQPTSDGRSRTRICDGWVTTLLDTRFALSLSVATCV